MVGTGYVGLVSGACFSDFGHDVVCVDKDSEKIEALNRGTMPIFEPGLDKLVERNVRGGRLSFTTDLEHGVAEAQAVFIAVGTPSRRGDGHADLSYVFGAAEEIAGALRGPAVVVTKSTVPVGTGDEVERIIREGAGDSGLGRVQPEFLREGAAIEDFKRPDGSSWTDETRTAEMMGNLRPLYLTRRRSVHQRRTAS
jgi:UDPglucose 6-dehydrogenase